MIRLLRPRTPYLALSPRASRRPYVVAVAVGLALGLVLSAFGVLLTRKNDSTSASAGAFAGAGHDQRQACDRASREPAAMPAPENSRRRRISTCPLPTARRMQKL